MHGSGKVQFLQDDFLKLLAAERVLSGMAETFAKAEKCGVNCDLYREAAKNMSSALIGIKTEFMGEFTVPEI